MKKAIESLKRFQIYKTEKSTPSKGRKFLKFGPKFENFGLNFWKIFSLRVVKSSKNRKNFRNSVSLRVDFRTLAQTYPSSRKPSTPGHSTREAFADRGQNRKNCSFRPRNLSNGEKKCAIVYFCFLHLVIFL